MVINLCGPPAVGKSTFAARFVLEHPQFSYFSIDQFRIDFQDETNAWAALMQHVLTHENVILETSGLSWRLNLLMDQLGKRKIFTIKFVADREILIDRLRKRQKRSVPMPYHTDELEFIDWAIENDNEYIFPIDFEVITTTKDVEDIYRICSAEIAKFRVQNSI